MNADIPTVIGSGAYRWCRRCEKPYRAGTYRQHRAAHVVIHRKPSVQPTSAQAERRAAIVAAWQSGKGPIEVGAEFGITRERVRQILKYAGIESSHHPALPPMAACLICGGQYVRGQSREHAAEANHDLVRGRRQGRAAKTMAMAKAYAAGDDAREIAERFGVSRAAVYRAALVVHGPLRYRDAGRVGPRKPQQMVAVGMLKQGMPTWRIAEVTGLAPGLIYHLRARYIETASA